jgi:hypothetical protein
MAITFPKNATHGQTVTNTASDGSILIATYNKDKNAWEVKREPGPSQVVVSPQTFAVNATADGQVITWNATLNKWIASAIPSPSQQSLSSPQQSLRLVTENPVVVSDTDRYLLLDLPTGVEPLITLPDPTSCEGRELHIKNYHAAVARSTVANVRSNRDYSLIDNQITANANGAWAALISDGTAWVKLHSYPTTDS